MNIRFILFVFRRFIEMFLFTSFLSVLFTYAISNPSIYRLENAIVFGIISTILPASVLFGFTFAFLPYYDCKRGNHILLTEFHPDDAFLYCSKCTYRREFTVDEYKAITIKKYVRMYPNK